MAIRLVALVLLRLLLQATTTCAAAAFPSASQDETSSSTSTRQGAVPSTIGSPSRASLLANVTEAPEEDVDMLDGVDGGHGDGQSSSQSDGTILLGSLLGGFAVVIVVAATTYRCIWASGRGCGKGAKRDRNGNNKGRRFFGWGNKKNNAGPRDMPHDPSFPRPFMQTTAGASTWATVEDGGEDSAMDQHIDGTNPMLGLPSKQRQSEQTCVSEGTSSASGTPEGAVAAGASSSKNNNSGGRGRSSRGPHLRSRSLSASYGSAAAMELEATARRNSIDPISRRQQRKQTKGCADRSSSVRAGGARGDAGGDWRPPTATACSSVDAVTPSIQEWQGPVRAGRSRSSSKASSTPTTPSLLGSIGSDFLSSSRGQPPPPNLNSSEGRRRRAGNQGVRRSSSSADAPYRGGGVWNSASAQTAGCCPSSRVVSPGICCSHDPDPQTSLSSLVVQSNPLREKNHPPPPRTHHQRQGSAPTPHILRRPPSFAGTGKGDGFTSSRTKAGVYAKSRTFSSPVGNISSPAPLTGPGQQQQQQPQTYTTRQHILQRRPSSTGSPGVGRKTATAGSSSGSTRPGEHPSSYMNQLTPTTLSRKEQHAMIRISRAFPVDPSAGGLAMGEVARGETPRGVAGQPHHRQESPSRATAAAAAGVQGASALALSSAIPAVRDAIDLVERLVRSADAERSRSSVGRNDNGGGGGGHYGAAAAKERERCVRWCGSVVRSLEKAGQLLSMATAHDRKSKEQILMENIQDSISEMTDVLESYESRGCSAAEASLSELCARRKGNLEAAINAYNSIVQNPTGDDPGSLLPSHVGQHRPKPYQEVVEGAAKWRRQRRLEHVAKLSVSECEIMGDEILGRAGGSGAADSGSGDGGSNLSSVVYLADCYGLNAAVKVLSFVDEAVEVHRADGDSYNSTGEFGRENLRRQRRRRRGCGFQRETSWAGEAENEAHVEQDWEDEGVSAGDTATRQRRRRRRRRRRETFLREIETLRRLRGPRIVTLFGVVGSGSVSLEDDASHLGVVMELMPGGSLRQLLDRSVEGGSSQGQQLPLDKRALRRIVMDVCSGLAFLHAAAFVHGGLSSTNVLLDAKGRAKVSDLSTLMRTSPASPPPHTPSYAETPGATGIRSRYTAPEVLDGTADHSFESDTYSFGMLVLECLNPGLDWSDYSGEQGKGPPPAKRAPRDLRTIVEWCCALDPASRPALDSIVFRSSSSGGGKSGRVVVISEASLADERGNAAADAGLWEGR